MQQFAWQCVALSSGFFLNWEAVLPTHDPVMAKPRLWLGESCEGKTGISAVTSSRRQPPQWTAHSPSWESDSSSAIQLFRKLSRNRKAHYQVHKNPPLDSEPDQSNPYPLHPISLRTIWIWCFNLRGLFTSRFPIKILHTFLSSPYMLHDLPSNPLWLHFNYNWWRGQIIQLLITQYSPAFHCFILPGPNIPLSAMFSNTPSPCSSFNVKDYAYRTSWKERTN
jgi:hypothetical protein